MTESATGWKRKNAPPGTGATFSMSRWHTTWGCPLNEDPVDSVIVEVVAV
ncbi:MAG: hypothetical protein R3D26_23930 [Cyanobacteriota/Melainabacteria group bacterium]